MCWSEKRTPKHAEGKSGVSRDRFLVLPPPVAAEAPAAGTKGHRRADHDSPIRRARRKVRPRAQRRTRTTLSALRANTPPHLRCSGFNRDQVQPTPKTSRLKLLHKPQGALQ